MTEKQAVSRIAAYCSKAERCKYDVKNKLVRWELEDEIIGKIISLMEKENFLDEERFCQSFIRDKVRFNKWGKNKIVFELKKKHIPGNIISSSFRAIEDECDFETPLLKSLQTKLASVKAKTEQEKRMKLFRFAVGRGYNFDMVNKCLDKLLGNTGNEYNF